MTERRQHILLLVLLGLTYFIGNGNIPVSDPVESNYAQTAVEMLRSGDYISPRIYGHPWYDKPVFFYWELIAAYSLFGITDFAARFFPSLVAFAGVLLTYFFARRLYGESTGFWSAIVLGTSLIYWCLEKLIITDMSLFLFLNGTLSFFYLAYHEKKRYLYWPAYALAGLAVLVKGPVGLLLPGLIILLFLLTERNLKELGQMKLFSGFLLFFLVCSPWYWKMYLLHGQEFLDTFLGVHNYLRATVSEHPKWNVWYYYLGILLLGAIPWSLTFPGTLWKRWKARNFSLGQKEKFLLLWALVINVFFQCMATKYPTYSFPAFLPIAILIAHSLESRGKALRNLALSGALLFLVATGVLMAFGQKDGHFAGKIVASDLENRLHEEDLLAIFGDYRASVVYYTQHTMYALETSEEKILERTEKGRNWNSKNVMPFIAVGNLPKDRDIYLIVNENRFNEFDVMPGREEWQYLMNVTAKEELLRLYYRPSNQEGGKVK